MGKTKRPTPQSVEKIVRSGRMKKISYLFERDGMVEFNPPSQSNWNRMLANHPPHEMVDDTGKLAFPGELGKVTRFFLEKTEMQKLQSIFEEFHIPAHLHADFTWCYLNMAFARADAVPGDQYRSNLDRSLNCLHQLFAFLESLTGAEAKISSVQIKYTTVPDPKSRKPPKVQTLKMTGPLDTGYLEDVLKLFRQLEQYPALNSFREVAKHKTQKPLDRNMGHKNAQKHAQAYYAGALFDFLTKNVFSDLRAFVNDLPKLREETAKLKKIYSDRQLCHFIGVLMQESGLVPHSKQDMDDEDVLIDLIKKKIPGLLKARAARRKPE